MVAFFVDYLIQKEVLEEEEREDSIYGLTLLMEKVIACVLLISIAVLVRNDGWVSCRKFYRMSGGLSFYTVYRTGSSGSHDAEAYMGTDDVFSFGVCVYMVVCSGESSKSLSERRRTERI